MYGKNITATKHVRFWLLGLVLFSIGEDISAQCGSSNLNADFSYTVSRTCGFPRRVSFTNTSTGSSASGSKYHWYVNGRSQRTVVGLSSFSYGMDTPGTYYFRLIGHDTVNNCRDTFVQSYQLVPVGSARRAKNQLGSFSFAPIWNNCISGANTPDTFGVFVEVDDTMRNYIIIWGDGKSNHSGTQLLRNQKVYHKYDSLGVFQLRIAYDNGNCTDTLKGIVSNERQPVAGIVGPPTGQNQGCVPLRVRYINNSSYSSPNTSFTWDFGDGSQTVTWTSEKFRDTIFHTYRRFLCDGIVTLIAKNGCGSSFTTWNPIQASSKDSAIIGLSNPNNCDTAVDFTFLNLSEDRYCLVPDVKKWKWIWGDGTTTGWIFTNAPQKKKYDQYGNYTILLIDSNACGMDTGKFILNFIEMPQAAFTIKGPTSGCVPFTVEFVNQSVGASMSFLWNFDDPTAPPADRTSTAKDPTKVFMSARATPYKVVLRTSNRCGAVYDTMEFTVYRKAQPNFTIDRNAGCRPLTVRATNITSETLSKDVTYSWRLGNGNTFSGKTPPAVTFTQPGSYTMTLFTTDTCGTDSFSRTITVYDLPVADFNYPSLGRCVNDTFIIQNTSANSNIFNWSFGDGTTLTQTNVFTVKKRYDSIRTYQVRLIAQTANGCRDTIVKSVQIYVKPVAAFSVGTPDGCGPLLSAFTNNSTHGGGGSLSAMSFAWNFGGGRSSRARDTSMHFPASLKKDTLHTVKLSAWNVWGCKDSTSENLTVYPNPTPRFTLTRYAGCAPLNAITFNTSFPNDTGTISIMKFVWNFGVGRNSTAVDSNFTFYASRTKDTIHNVKLIAISEHGCKDSLTRQVRVYPKPLSRFTPGPQEGCRPLSVNFTNTSIPNDTGSIWIMKFKWLFNWRDTSGLMHPQRTYTERHRFDTSYEVGLVAISEHGCRDTSYRYVTLRPDAYADFDPDIVKGCGPLTVNFENTSIHANAYTWAVQGRLVGSLTDLTHTFRQREVFDSVYRVTLMARSMHGCRNDTVTKDITVYGDPIASYAVIRDTFCFPEKIQFFNQSLHAYRFRWNLGQGTITTAQNPSAFFPKNPVNTRDTTYRITLVSESAYGCKDTTQGTMTVLPYPEPAFTVDIDKGCSPLTVNFTNNSLNTRGYNWDLGNGFSYRVKDLSHTFINRGPRDTMYRVTLFTYSLDCMDSTSIAIPVYRPTEAYFKYERVNPCDAGYFDFMNESVNGTNYIWDFDDGTRSAVMSPRHLFPVSPYQDTTFDVKLISISNRGCMDSMVREVKLPQRLIVDVHDSSQVRCIPGEVAFLNRTRGAVSYLWDFGDGLGSSVRFPVHQYMKPGIFRYKLVAFDANGCRDSFVSNGRISVGETPIAQMTFTPNKARMPDSYISFFSLSTSSLPLSYYWNFNDPGSPSVSTRKDDTHRFSDSGWYDIVHIASNSACADTAYDRVRIDWYLPIPEFTVDRDSGCAPLEVQFYNQTQYAEKYTWYFGDGNRSNERDPRHIYRYGGEYDVRLISEGPGGEMKEEKLSYIKVLPSPFGLFQITPEQLYLPRADFFTRNLTRGAVDYYWDVYNHRGINQASSRLFEPMFKAQDTGWYAVRLISVSDKGCRDTMLMPNAVYANPKGMLYVPTAFTPNNDGRNDIFKPEYANILETHYLLRIYDRWGAKLFETTDVKEGWDGTVKGKLLPMGVYVWKINARLISGDDIQQDGVVHLMR
jgi:gliding motility-associated-like protein